MPTMREEGDVILILVCHCGYGTTPRKAAHSRAAFKRHHCRSRACPDCGGTRSRQATYCLPCGQERGVRALREWHASVDEIAVDRLIAGTRVRSTRAERQAAVAYLTRHGMSAREIARRTGMSSRTVQRLRGRVA